MTRTRLDQAVPIYDELADVYDRWLSGDDAAEPCLRHYQRQLAGCAGPVLELGVGTGRIAAALAASGIDVLGLDVSEAMIRRALAEHAPAGVARMVRGRFEQLPFAADTFESVILPMRTVGHLTAPQAQAATFAEVARVIRPGGRFHLDHYQLDREWAERHDGVPRLMYAGPGDDDLATVLLIWDRYDYDFAARMLRCVVRQDRRDHAGALLRSSIVTFDFRWFEAAELIDLAAGAGFAVAGCWGDFAGAPLTAESEHIVLDLRRVG
jgi:SAM-dependent methyltransferase